MYMTDMKKRGVELERLLAMIGRRFGALEVMAIGGGENRIQSMSYHTGEPFQQ